MATTPPMRHTETGSADAGPTAVLRGPAPPRTAAAIAAAAAVFLTVVALAGVGRLDATMPAFLEEALGPETAEAPLERTPATGVGVHIDDHGYTVSHWGVSLSVASEDVGGSDWQRHVHGVTRDTEFGTETIVVNDRKTEELLTVSERQGTKTWRWKLASRLHPRLGRDGAVTFLDPTRHRVATLVIDPVRILDAGGDDVTPDGLRWGLEQASSGWVLTLKLDDADLPLPYLIDPAVTHRAAQTATTAAGTSLTVNVPAGVQANDLLVAHIARVGNAAINTPSGWTAAGGTNNGSSLRQATFYRVAGTSEPASYTWTWTGTQAAAGGMSAYYGIKASAPLDVIGTATTGNNTTTVTAASITTGANDALVLAFFSSNTNSTYSTATGMAERYEIGTTGAASIASDDMAQAVAGPTGAKTSTASTSGRVIGHQVSFNVDDVAPIGSLTDPGSPLAGTVVLTGSAADSDSAVAGVTFQRSPANAGTWTDIGAADTTSPYTASFDTTAVTDGFYDLRVAITDVAGNATNSTIVEDRLVDNTAPASATTFPAGSGTYNVAGWEGGCTTIGLCGSFSDAGAGVSRVEISLRQGSGNYWDGTGFTSSAEVWNDASLSSGDWSYAFAAASFPAAGSYTVRVRAVDGAANTESPSSRTFTIDPTAPQTTIDSTPPDPTGSASAEFGFSSSEAGSTFECRIDGGSWGACTSPAGYTSLADGSHTFDVRATDAAGNQDGSAASYTWLVDTTAPSSITTFPAAGGEYNAAGWTAGCAGAGLCGTYSDGTGSGVSQVQVSIRQGSGDYWDGSGFSSASEVWNTASLAGGNWSYALAAGSFPADGGYTVRVRAVDTVANTETPSSRAFTYDTTTPSALVGFPASGGNYSDTGWDAGCATSGLCGTSSDGGSGVQAVQVSMQRLSTGLYWDGLSFSSATETYEAASLAGGDWSLAFPASSFPADGQYTVHVRAADDAGNVESGPSRTFTYDTTAPQTTIDSSPADPTGATAADFDFSAGEAGAGFECRLDGGAWGACASPAGYTGLADGSHTFQVRATDLAGNTDSTPASFSWLVDTAAPSSSIAFPAAGGEYTAAAWNAGCPGSGLCGTYGDGFGSGVDQVQLSVQRVSTGLYWDGASFSSGTEVLLTASLAGGDWTHAFPASSFPADGDYAVRVFATDETGNAETPASRTFGFDATDPTGSLTEPADGAALRGSSVTVSSDSADAGSGVATTEFQRRPAGGGTWTTIDTDSNAPYTATWDTTPLADGDYDLRVLTTDQAGNTHTSALRTVTVDNTAPLPPVVTLSESSPFASVSGTEIFVNTNETGTYGVSATSSDGGSGLDKVAFPGGVEDAASPYSTTYDLDDLSGSQTVTVHDVAGNTSSDTFTVTPDTAAPAGGSVDYPDGYDADGTVTVTVDPGTDALSGLDPGSGVLERRTSALTAGVCDPFVGGWSPVTSPDTVPDNTCARYRYRVSDRVGNEAISTLPTSTVKVDLTTPQTTIDVAPGDPSSAASPTFEFSASEGGVSFECRLDGDAWTACTSPEAIGPLADGGHTFEVRATDAAGNVDGSPAFHAWEVDTGAPDTSLDAVPADPSNDDAPSFAFSASEPGSTFECRLDGGAWAGCTSPETVGLLADGSHTFQVRATDAAGNVDGSPASYAWTVDTLAPESSFALVPADPTSDTSSTFEFTASESGVSFECRLDGDAWTACTSPETIGPLADGSHTFAVRATDQAGNQEATPEPYTWAVDGGAPSVSISQPSGFVNASDADPYTVRATSPDGDVATVELFRCSDASVDCAGGSWVSLGTDTTAPYEASWPVDADGNRALRAVVTDSAANTGSDVVNVTIDRTVPATTIDSAPSDPSGSVNASFAFSSGEGGASFECRLDGGSWDSCSSPHGYAGLSDGSHVFEVRAFDAAGNVDPTPATFGWTVDTIAPETTIDAAPSDPSASSAPSFEFSASEGGSTFECRLDGGAWDACSSPHAYSGLSDGEHTFRVRATDAAGNVDGAPAVHAWMIDATPPGGGLADPGQFLRGTVALSASPSDTGAGVESVDFQVSPADAGSWTSLGLDTSAPYGVDWDTTALADGVYDLRIVVTDNADNSGPSAVVEDRVVDNTAPGATMNDPGAYLHGTVSLGANATDAGSGVATVAFEGSPAGAGSWTPVASSWNTTSVADGLYDLRVRVTDNAGNSAVSSPVADRRVDNTRPSLTSSTPADGTTLASASSLAVAASEDVAGIADAQIDGAAVPAPTVSGTTVTYTQTFSAGPHLLAGELEDLAGNRQPIRIHFTIWSGQAGDFPYVEKNSEAATSMSLRSTSDTATVTVPAGAWTGAPAGDWLVLRLDPQPASGGSGGFEPAGDVLDVTAYWALDGSAVTSFTLPLQIEVDSSVAHVVPAVLESGAWRPLAQVPGGSLPASWNDGFLYEGSNVRILTRHLSLFTLLEDVQAPTKPGGFKGTVSRGTFSLSWTAASDNSGLISAYRVYANGAVVKTVGGSSLTTPMGTFTLTDKRSFQVAAVDEAGNVGPRSGSLKVIPKLAKLTLASAKTALTKRSFKLGTIRYKTSSTVAKGRVIAGSASGLRPAGSKIGLTVSKGKAASARPTTSAIPTAPPTPPATGSATTPPPPSGSPVGATTAESTAPEGGRVVPFVGTRSGSLSDLRQELGFGILAAAFSIVIAAGFRAGRGQTARTASDPEQLLLWDQRLARAIRRVLRFS